MEDELGIHAKKVLGTLHKLSKGKEDFSVSYTDIAKFSKLEKTMVSSCLRILRDKHYINVVSGGGAATNIYSFLKEVPQEAIDSIKNISKEKQQPAKIDNQSKPNKRKIRP